MRGGPPREAGVGPWSVVADGSPLEYLAGGCEPSLHVAARGLSGMVMDSWPLSPPRLKVTIASLRTKPTPDPGRLHVHEFVPFPHLARIRPSML
ncbi:hypothetical protein CDD83_9027 [Cordyceps sp. RAO-2017]|nr:hypothetical protein CDD83_9027 [Cordyceps sp. RAO-2017]